MITKTVHPSLSSPSQTHAGKQAFFATLLSLSANLYAIRLKRVGQKTRPGLIQNLQVINCCTLCHNLTFSICTTEAPAVLAPRDLAVPCMGEMSVGP